MAEPNTSHLSIGEVLGLLLEEFPDITISKIRFLESQGLIEPERTPSGYRKFYEHDVELLRVILREQREHFLPLRVIKDRLDAGVIEREHTATRQPGARAGGRHAHRRSHRQSPGGRPQRQCRAGRAVHSYAVTNRAVGAQRSRRDACGDRSATNDDSPRLLPGVVVNREELCTMASITAAQLASLEEYGVIGRRKGAR